MPAKFDRCVRKVKAAGKVDNPYAICNASLKKGKMKEMKTLDRMKHKIVESLTNRVEEGFARELGRGLGGAYRIIRGGVTKTADAMARSGQKGLESGGWKGAFGGMAKEGLKGLASGGSKLATGAAKTGISLLKSVGKLSPQQKRGVVAAYRGKRDQNQNAPATPTVAPSKPSPYGPDAEPLGPHQKAINPVTGIQQAKRRKDYLKDIEIQKDRERVMGSRAQDSTELFGQKIVESFSTMVEMKINKMIDRKEVRRMKAAGVSKEARREFTADDVARKAKDAEIKASMGPNNPKNTFRAKPKLNKKYIEGGKKGKSETPMTKAQIDRSGTGGKPAAGRPGKTKKKVLDDKLAKIDRTSTAFMANLARNPKNSEK